MGESYQYDYLQEHSGADMGDDYFLIGDTAWAIQLPQYNSSKNPFLAQAEQNYNSFLFMFNLWSNYDVWRRNLFDTQEVTACINSISVYCIRDEYLRNAAKVYKDSIVLLMNIPISFQNEDISPAAV